MKEILDITNSIKPRTDLEKQIIRSPDFWEGANWGKPRRGHPEGKVILHIVDVLKNIDNINALCSKNNINPPDEETIAKLRLIAIIHDTFKYKVDTTKPKSGENHHAMIARRFAEKFIDDPLILDIIELHDEAYLAQRSETKDKRKGEQRFFNLIKKLMRDDQLWVYTLFYMCDNATGDKDEECFISYKHKLEGIKLQLIKYDFLEGQEFYDLMQIYRHTPISDQTSVTAAFDNIKEFIKDKIKY